MTHFKSLMIAAGLAVGALAMSAPAPAIAETDACAGQTWPNLSDDCIKQIVKKVCEAGGGTTCTGGDAQTVDRRTFEKFVAAPMQRPTAGQKN